MWEREFGQNENARKPKKPPRDDAFQAIKNGPQFFNCGPFFMACNAFRHSANRL